MGVILDVAVGLVFLYLLLALVATTVQELIATVLRLRATHLYDALTEMLKGSIQTDAGSKRIIEEFYKHPLIKNLCKRAPRFEKGKLVSRYDLPSYIESETFVLAMLDVLRGDTTFSNAVGARDVLAKASTTIDKITNNDDLRRLLSLLVTDVEIAADQLDAAAARVSARIEAVFNERMARASGWYKRQAQWIALVIAAVITVATNADTIHVGDRLWKDAPLRAAVVASAGAYEAAAEPSRPASAGGLPPARSDDSSAPGAAGSAGGRGGSSGSGAPGTSGGVGPAAPGSDSNGTAALEAGSQGNGASVDDVRTASLELKKKIDALDAAHLPIGWPREEERCFPLTVLGWLITALAVSLGSNFWFDVLSSTLQLRGGGPKVSATTGRAGKEASDD